MNEKQRRKFAKLMEAQEAIRAWYLANPKQEPPQWMKQQLLQAHLEYEKVKQANHEQRRLPQD